MPEEKHIDDTVPFTAIKGSFKKKLEPKKWTGQRGVSNKENVPGETGHTPPQTKQGL